MYAITLIAMHMSVAMVVESFKRLGILRRMDEEDWMMDGHTKTAALFDRLKIEEAVPFATSL